jgi:hypothetical protein
LEGAFNRDRSGLRKGIAATCNLNVLVNDFLSILRGCGRGKEGKKKRGAYDQFASVHDVQR